MIWQKSIFQIGLSNAPNDEYLLMDYAKFLLRIIGNTKEAKALAEHAYNQQSNNFDFNALLAEIAIKEGELEKARNYLEVLNNDLANTYSYGQLRNLLLTEAAIAEQDYQQAQELLDSIIGNTHPYYINLVKNLESRLNQFQQSFVKEQD